MLNNVSPRLMSKIQQTLPDAHLTDLASLVLQLDEAKTHIGNLSSCYSFNQCLDRYLHILLTYHVLSDQKQVWYNICIELFMKPLKILWISRKKTFSSHNLKIGNYFETSWYLSPGLW